MLLVLSVKDEIVLVLALQPSNPRDGGLYQGTVVDIRGRWSISGDDGRYQVTVVYISGNDGRYKVTVVYIRG